MRWQCTVWGRKSLKWALAILLHIFESTDIDDVGSAFIFAGGFVIAAGYFVSFVTGEAMLFDVLITQSVFGRSFGIFTGNIGSVKNFANRITRLRMCFKRCFGHALNALKGIAVATVRQNFLIYVDGHFKGLNGLKL